MIESLHFLRPWWLLALLALPLLGFLLHRRASGGGAWQQFVDPALLPHVLEQGQAPGTRWSLWLGVPAAALAIVALAGPAWERLPQPVFHGQSPLVLAMDLSRSMNAADVPPSRVARARLKVLDILNQRKDGQTALVAFAGDAFVVSPLTDDAATIASMVPSLEPAIMPAQGSNVTAALEEAAALLTQAGAARGDVLLLTDSPAEPETLQAARRLSSLGHRLSVLAIGTREGAPVMLGEGRMLRDRNGNIVVSSVDTESLASLAMAGGGAFSGLTVDDTDLARLLPGTSGFTGAVEAEGEIRTDQWREEGPWLLLPLLPLAALLFRRGVIVCLLVMCAPWPVQAAGPADTLADTWVSLWQRPDQRGAELFEAQKPSQAASEFEDAEWRAAAHFRAGNYAQSASDLDGVDTPRGHYNRGNALAMAQDIGGAIAAYQRALELDPDHEDARHNLEQLLQQQEQQQQQQGEGESDSESAQDSESQGEQQDGDGGEQGDQGEQQQQQQSSQGEQEQQANSQQGSDAQDEQGARESDAEAAGSMDEPGEEDEGDAEDEAERQARAAQLAEQELQDEERQSAELWLRRIPDDPGGLLRRKLLYQHRQRDRRGETEEEPW